MPTFFYAVTQTLNKSQQTKSVESQLLSSKMIIQQVVKQLPNISKVHAVFEFTKRNKIQSHSIYSVWNESTDKQKAYRDFSLLYEDITRRMGFSCIKMIFDDTEWLRYMTKDMATTIQAINLLREHHGAEPKDERYIQLKITRIVNLLDESLLPRQTQFAVGLDEPQDKSNEPLRFV